HTLFKNLKLNSAKRELLRELDLLIIDEVSMVRADMLDAVDAILRNVRRQPLKPFGGVQVLYIGDLYQLPPVIRQDEWELMQKFYKSPFFFDALVVQEEPPVYIELKTIYRQNDAGFIHILNNIRNNRCTESDLDRLHKHYQPDFHPSPEENYIILTSHNDKADAINKNELDKLPDIRHTFTAAITGEFSERSYPVEPELHLKAGAQIMFIKNDKGENRRYYNGKIAVIDSISRDTIMISFPGEEGSLELEREKWQNIRYKYNNEKDTFEEEELGTFTQYPVRLAWAITIHKSQGLTFDRAIIDAGASFAAGQVYVALSRLTGLEGLVLRSRIRPGSIRTDERVLQFVQNEFPESVLQETLEHEQQTFIYNSLLKRFDWSKIASATEQHIDDFESKQLANKHICISVAGILVRAANSQYETAKKFLRQLERVIAETEADGHALLHQRVSAAADYFIKEIEQGLLAPLEKHQAEVKSWPKIKKYIAELEDLKIMFVRQRQHLQQAVELTAAMQASADRAHLLQLAESMQKPSAIEDEEVEVTTPATKKTKAHKGDSQRVSLQLYKEGRTIAEIAAERSLARGTIETHLSNFIPTGEVDALALVSQEKLDKIIGLLEEQPDINSWSIKQALGEDFSYADIRAGLKHFERLKLAQ
ncbi:MAG TPA: helix-turn-helix domain-containing protein, partial [Chitinophagaceae bacterium]